MIRIHLSCRHEFDTGYLNEKEKYYGETECPICKKTVTIMSVFELVHPKSGWRNSWVEGRSVWVKRR